MNEDIWTLLGDLKIDDTLDSNFENVEDEEDDSKCFKCGCQRIICDEGQNICMECNALQSRIIETTAEWRYYGADDSREDNPTRCGMPTNDLLPKSSLGSIISGKKNESREQKQVRRYQMWNSMPYWERTLYTVFEQLNSNTQNQGIPIKVLNDAKVLYKRASEKKISRGENKEGLIASCIYYACLLNKIPRSPKEVAKMFHIDPYILTKGNARFQILLNVNVDTSNPDDYISRFGSRLNMSCTDIKNCKELAQKLDELEIVSENAPTSVAAGTIFYYCTIKDLDYNKKQIAEVCDVSEVTITKCYKRLLKYKEMIEI